MNQTYAHIRGLTPRLAPMPRPSEKQFPNIPAGVSTRLLTLGLTSAALQADEPNQSNQKIMNPKTEPFIRIREVSSSTPWGGWVKTDIPLELRQQYFMPFWSEARLRRHLEMIAVVGVNSCRWGRWGQLLKVEMKG